MLRPHSSGQNSGEPLCSGHHQAVQITVWAFPEPVHLERVCQPSAWLTCCRNRARLCFFVSSTWSSPKVTHPSTIHAQCCLTSEFKLELVFPTCHQLLEHCNSKNTLSSPETFVFVFRPMTQTNKSKTFLFGTLMMMMITTFCAKQVFGFRDEEIFFSRQATKSAMINFLKIF